jgi:hypothetical protein
MSVRKLKLEDVKLFIYSNYLDQYHQFSIWHSTLQNKQAEIKIYFFIGTTHMEVG